MNIVILGAGALGTVLGAHLAKAGEEVTLMARGNRAAYLQEHGATITGLADFTVPVTVVTEPRQVKETDALIVTIKTYDTEAALDSVKHMQTGSVLSIQNGVLKDEQLADVFGWDKVLGATVVVSAEVLPTGVVNFTANQGFHLGELPEGTSERVQSLADTLNLAGIQAQVWPSIQSIEWSKYVMLVGSMALAVLSRLETYKFMQNPLTASVSASLFHEMVQLARARGIALEDIPIFPAKTFSQLSLADTVVQLRQQGDWFAAQAPTHKVSILQDLEQGKPLEVEEILGYAARQAAELGVPTPTLDTCYKLIAGINSYLL
jgi:2-dehydropantoate 2-reductase